jgi:hypothetical protein
MQLETGIGGEKVSPAMSDVNANRYPGDYIKFLRQPIITDFAHWHI